MPTGLPLSTKFGGVETNPAPFGIGAPKTCERIYRQPEYCVKPKAIPDDNGAEEMLEKLDMRKRLTRGGEIQKELEKLYEELGKFPDPTPADKPARVRTGGVGGF